MKILHLILLLALPLLSLPTHAARPVATTIDLPTIPYEKYKLKNGLEVILVEDHRLPLVAVDTWYHVGAADEAPGRTGFAHLFEHMMFAGSKHVPRGMADSLLEAAGGDSSNGSTSFDRTNYFETVPSHQLELDLWLHADRMGYLLDVLDQAALTNQKDVVRNERRQTHESRPYGVVEEALWHNLFPKTHPYHGEVIGSHADIQSATLEDIKAFFKLHYRPNNATLVIVGDIDKPKTKQLVEKYFGALQRGPDVPHLTVAKPVINEEKRVTVEDRVELQRVIMGWHTPKIFAPGDAELSLAGHILSGGKSSRLYRSLVYEREIAQNVSAYQYSLELGSIFVVDVTARPGVTAEDIEAAIDDELEELHTARVDPIELERARNTIETEMIAGLEKFGGLADLLNYYNHYTGDPGYFKEEIKLFEKITPEQIENAVGKYLKESNRVVIYGVPGKPNFGPDVPSPPPATTPSAGTESINADESWRKDVPKPGKQRSFALPKGNAFKLANGLTIIHHHKTDLPLVSAYLVFKSGSEANPPNKPGLASFTTDLLDEGTTTRASVDIANEIAQLGASLSANASPDASTVELFSLKKNFAKGAEIMADIVLNPSFPDEEVERQRASRLGDVAQIHDSASAVASITGVAALYGFSHPYGYPTVGSEASIQATTRNDLVDFWKQHFLPNNAALIVSGDITHDELKTYAESLFGKWKPGEIKIRPPVKPETTSARVVLVDKPGAPQTALRVTTIATNRNTPDYAPMEVLSAGFGELFTSRLNNKLREDKGYTYSVTSEFRYRRLRGPFEVRTAVRTDATAATVQAIMAELRNLKKNPITGAELRKARDSQVLSLPGGFETGMSIVHSLAEIFVHDLGLDYFTRLPAALQRVDAKQVAAAADKYLQPEKMIVIAVGDKEKIEPELAKLKLGPVECRNLDGKVISCK